MNRNTGIVSWLEKVFWAFLFVNPFLDIFNGVYINVIMGVGVVDAKNIGTLGVTPSLLLRMLMLLAFALYILLVRDWKAVLTVAGIGAATVLSIVSEYLAFGNAGFFMDAQYSARFCYNVVVCLVYARVFAGRFSLWGKEGLLRRLDAAAAFTLLALSLSILISALTGAGYSTYADRMGMRGSRGFFYSGNDIIGVLSLLLPVCMVRFMAKDRREMPVWEKLFYAVSCGAGTNALVVLGSKTAFLAAAATYGLLLCAAVYLYFRRGRRAEAAGYLWCLCSALVIFALMMLLSGMEIWEEIMTSVSVTQKYAEREGVETALLSGRSDRLRAYWELYRGGGPLVWLFGMGRSSVEKILEMDVFEVLFFYGVFGCIAMLWLYVKLAAELVRGVFRSRPLTLTALALLAALVCGAGYLFLAGHVLFSVTSGFYFSFVIIYSRVFLAQGPEEVLLWKNGGLSR